MLYAEEAWLRDGFTRLAQGEARTRGGGVYKAFGRLADQAIPLSWYGNTVSTADAVSAAADLAHDWDEASEKMGEEGASAALWIGQTSYTAPQCAMIFLKSAVSRVRAKLKTATSAVVRENFCPCFFHERNGAPARGAPCIENMH